MDYHFKSMKISDIVDLIDKDKVNLSPYYQRKDIWTKNDQEALIDSILNNYPLPNLFIYNNEGIMEVVDGQQRIRTIYRFVKNNISSSRGEYFNSIKKEEFLNYKLPIIEIFNLDADDDIAEFYVLVNKKGKHLTTPELYKAEFHDKKFMKLAEEILDEQSFIDLNLFTEASSKRMNDRSYVEELLAYLKYGIQDKKSNIETIYKNDISDEEYEFLKDLFIKVLTPIHALNDVHNLSRTRYKQKNDFYTLFNFVHQNLNQDLKTFKAQYKVLLLISEYISPSNDDCEPLKNYALDCVSQSNSKKARERRLMFFNYILKNKSESLEDNEVLGEIANYIEKGQFFPFTLNKVDEYYLLDIK
ncbi:DUF262 domain-containing protein [Robiginitalea sp. M366]|uniref:DUF262 domain-containing protein n=1 Tax=Robiginitalea aestuariiviva TaxID=3036903 RepID=UPI00240E07AF|nr:DUF262 domain-containing protein [Robiginitalea aestuariiviva]MDG1571399.1 DUF262 domain-containing protein [Robiginitalea aestuariiviva]